MDTKSRMQELIRHLDEIARGRELNVLESDARDAAYLYLTQCQEVERLQAKLDRLQTRVIEITGRKQYE